MSRCSRSARTKKNVLGKSYRRVLAVAEGADKVVATYENIEVSTVCPSQLIEL